VSTDKKQRKEDKMDIQNLPFQLEVLEEGAFETPIPKAVTSLFCEVKNEVPSAVLAGGFLCDCYLGYGYKDIDVFVENKELEKVRTFLSRKNIHSNWLEDGPYGDRWNVMECAIKGYRIQFILVDSLSETLKNFDFTFREFFYDGETIFASSAAIQAIKEEELVINGEITRNWKRLVIEDMSRFLVRMLSFQTKYGFMLSDEDNEHIKANLKEMEERFIKRIKDEVRERVCGTKDDLIWLKFNDYMETISYRNVFIPFDQKAIQHELSIIHRSLIESLESMLKEGIYSDISKSEIKTILKTRDDLAYLFLMCEALPICKLDWRQYMIEDAFKRYEMLKSMIQSGEKSISFMIEGSDTPTITIENANHTDLDDWKKEFVWHSKGVLWDVKANTSPVAEREETDEVQEEVPDQDQYQEFENAI
jgi:hypothetical protein